MGLHAVSPFLWAVCHKHKCDQGPYEEYNRCVLSELMTTTEVKLKKRTKRAREQDIKEQHPRADKNDPRVNRDDPRVTRDVPWVTQGDLRVTQDDTRVTQDEPRVTQDEPRVTQEDPRVTWGQIGLSWGNKSK